MEPVELAETVLAAALSRIPDGSHQYGFLPPKVRREVQSILSVLDDPEALADLADHLDEPGRYWRQALTRPQRYEFDPNEPRDETGKWTTGAGAPGKTVDDQKPAAVTDKPRSALPAGDNAPPKELKAARRYRDVARRRRVIAAVKNEGRLADAIDGCNLPDSEPADVVYIEDAKGKPQRGVQQVRDALRHRARAVEILADPKETGERREQAEKVLSQRCEFYEVKTLLKSSRGSVSIGAKPLKAKEQWEQKYQAAFSVVAVDDRRGRKHSGHRVHVAQGELAKTFALANMTRVNDFGDAQESEKYEFDPNQPRDQIGQWTDTGSGVSGSGEQPAYVPRHLRGQQGQAAPKPAQPAQPAKTHAADFLAAARSDAKVGKLLPLRQRMVTARTARDAADAAGDEAAYRQASNAFCAAEADYDRARDASAKAARALLPGIFAPEQPAALRAIGTDVAKLKKVPEALAFLTGLIGSEHGEALDVPFAALKAKTGPNSRSYWSDGMVFMNPGDDAGAVAHEVGHHLHADPRVKRACREFIARRTANETPTRLAEAFPDDGFRSDEVGRKDDWEKLYGSGSKRAFYTGLTYSDGQTEVLSMGLELMYRDPVHFAEVDPEYFDFVAGIVSGRLLGAR